MLVMVEYGFVRYNNKHALKGGILCVFSVKDFVGYSAGFS